MTSDDRGNMISRTTGRGAFVGMLSIVALFLALAVYQVPQPWRGTVVAWLLFLIPVGAFILRLVRHHYSYKSLQLTTRPPSPPRTAPRTGRQARRGRSGRLRIVVAQGASKGRHTL